MNQFITTVKEKTVKAGIYEIELSKHYDMLEQGAYELTQAEVDYIKQADADFFYETAKEYVTDDLVTTQEQADLMALGLTIQYPWGLVYDQTQTLKHIPYQGIEYDRILFGLAVMLQHQEDTGVALYNKLYLRLSNIKHKGNITEHERLVS